MRNLALVPLIAMLLACCSPGATAPPKLEPSVAPPSSAESRAARPDASGIDTAGIDTAVKPGDDFFKYANGAGMKSTEIPADRSSWGTHAAVGERTLERVAALIADASKKESPPGSDARKVGDYYAAYMDEAAIEAKGLEPLKGPLAAIAAIKDKPALARALGGALRADVDILNAAVIYTENLFGLWVAQDLDDPTKYSPFLVQGGLGLEDREYLLDQAARMSEIRTKYEARLATLFDLAKFPDGRAKAARVFALEKKIAQAHAPRNETDDVIKSNNHWARKDLAARAPGLDWDQFLLAAKLDKLPELVVWQPKAVTGISALVKSEPLDVWKDYLTVHLLNAQSGHLPKAFVDAGFAFYGRTLTGTPEQRPRWKRAVRETDAALGEVVGKLYVEKYFPPSDKTRAEAMVKNVVAAFARRIDALTWMAPKTKAEAKAKLAALKVGVGYPDKWRDYSGLEVVRGDALGNARRAALFDYERNLKKLGTPVDRGEWVMNAQLVDGVNLPAMNALNFPAAILQPPYFDPSRPAVMDYGAMGAVIGHEICHSFDDTGALFDSTGKLHDWWIKDDYAHFRASAEQLTKQFDAYMPFPDLHVNGKQTLGENIADVAGLSAAYDAYRLSLGGQEAPPVAGVTGDQQFFLSFAQIWRTKVREPALRQRVLTDAHAPVEYRADTVRNLDAWYTAFDVKPGQGLFLGPAERVRVY